MKLTRLVSIAVGTGISVVTVGASSAQAVLLVTPTDNANTLVSNILGTGVTASNLSYIGATNASATFTGGTSAGIGIESGIVLTTGNANEAVGPSTNSASVGNGLAGDADLDTLTSVTTQDATSLSFDFTTTSSDLFFNFVFASEEYPRFVGTGFNDVFGFFVNGVNIALIPGTTTPVSINTVNFGLDNAGPGTNSVFYKQNSTDNTDTPGSFNNAYGGFTTVFTASATGLSAGTNTLKLAIGDVGDGSLDSAVFLQANTLAAVTPVDPTAVPEPFTIVGTLIGGTAALRMRKKMKSADRV